MRKSSCFLFLFFIISIISCTGLLDKEKRDFFPKSYFNKNFFDLDSLEIAGKMLPSISGKPLNGYIEARVFDKDTGLPIVNSSVTVQFKSNSSITSLCNNTGVATFKNAELKPGVSITAEAEAYENFSILDLTSDSVTLYLSKKVEKSIDVDVTGKFTGWSLIKDYDGILDVGFMVPSLDLSSIVSFNLKSLFAPNVTIDIFGAREVPGNLVLPTQKENYFFFTIKLTKPSYIFPLSAGSVNDLVAISARIPFEKFVDGAQNGLDYSQLMNLVKFDRIGVVRDYLVKESASKDIHLSNSFNQKLRVSISNPPSNNDIVLIASGKFPEKRGSFFPISFNIYENVKEISSSLSNILPEGSFSKIQYLYGAMGCKLPKENEEINYGVSSEFKRSANPSGNASFSSFFKVIAQTEGSFTKGFSFVSPKNDGISPDVDFYIAKIFKLKDNKEKESIWTLILPKYMTNFALPQSGTIFEYKNDPEGTSQYYWSISAFALKADPNNAFSYSELNQDIFEDTLSHLSQNRATIN